MNVTAHADRESALKLFMKLGAPMVAFDAPRKWIQIARAGQYKGHPSGSFSFDAGSFDRIVANFDAQKNPVPVKYGHPRGEDDGAPVPAVGWIHDLEARADGSQLWAFVEFTSDAASLIRAGKYRYCSVVVDIESIHRETAKEIGPELLELGLVNNPFIDGMEPIRLSRKMMLEKESKMSLKDLLKEAMKVLPDDASVEQLMAYLSAKDAEQKAIEGPGKPSAEPEPEKEAAAKQTETTVALAADTPPGDAPKDDQSMPSGAGEGGAMGALAKALGLDMAALEGLMAERLSDLVRLLKGEPAPAEASAAPAPEGEATAAEVGVVANSRIRALSKQVVDRDVEIKKLSERVAAMEFEKVEARIDQAIASGQLLDVEREKIVKLARKAPELLDDFLAKAPAVPTGTATQPRKATAPSITEVGDDDERYVAMKVALSAARQLPKDAKEAHQMIVGKLSTLAKNRREERA